MPSPIQYVTLVSRGGTPVTLSDQHGAPYPTTGAGALVFANGPTITNAILEAATLNDATLNRPIINDPVFNFNGKAVGYGADGTTFQTTNVVSTQAYLVRDIFQTPGKNTCTIRLDVIPTITPTVLTVKIPGGLNGTNRRQHPADGVAWPLLAGADAWTFELLNSHWVIDSVFYPGNAVAYVPGTIIDSSTQLNALAAWARTHGPAIVQLPIGGLYVRGATVRWPENCKVMGHGQRRTFSWLADARDMPSYGSTKHLWGTGAGTSQDFANISNAIWQGVWLLGNRQHGKYLAGQHLIDLGGSTDLGVPITLLFDDMGLNGGAGYCMSWGGENAKFYCMMRKCTIGFSDSDTIDCKNRLNGNVVIDYDQCNFLWHALNTQGTALEATHTSAITIPITVTNGSRLFSVPQSFDPGLVVGDIVTIAAATFHQLNPSGDRTIISTASGNYTFSVTLGQSAANATGTSTGIGVTWYSKSLSAITIASIPITTVNGSTQFTIPRDTDLATQAGEITTMTGAVVNGLNPNGSLRVMAITSGSPGSITLDTLEDFNLQANPLTPQGIGTAVIRVNMPGHGRIGATKIQFTGTVNGNGITINPATVYDGTIIDIDTIQTTVGGSANALTAFGGSAPTATIWTAATSGSTSAGSNVTWSCPHISDGDVTADMRGIFMLNRSPTWQGECFGRNVYRGRGGDIQHGAGLGGSYMSIVGARFRDLGPAWLKNTTNSGQIVQMLGIGMHCVDIAGETGGGASLVVIGSDSVACILDDFYITGSVLGLDIRGDFAKVSNGYVENYGISTNASTVRAGASLDGATIADDQFLTADPFTANYTGGPSPTTTNVFAEAHGRVGPTFNVQFAGAVNANGLTVVPSNQPDSTYLATVVDANNYTVNLAGIATSVDAFGGDSVRAIYGSVGHTALGVQMSNVQFKLTANRSSGCVDVFLSSHVANPQVTGCGFYSATGQTCVITDNSLNSTTVWGPGNIGLPNNQRIIPLPADGSGITLTIADSGAMLVNPTNAAGINVVTLPDNTLVSTAPPGFWVDCQARNTTGANGIRFQTVAGTITDANNNSSNPGTFTSSTTGATCRIVWGASPNYRAQTKAGTWTLA